MYICNSVLANTSIHILICKVTFQVCSQPDIARLIMLKGTNYNAV